MRKNFGAKTYVYPQPVLIIGTYDAEGKPNAMNAAWGGICDADKFMIALGKHKTTDNIAVTKAFTVGIADVEHTVACDYVGIASGSKVPDKMERAGFTAIPGEFVHAPVFEQLPITLECELCKVLEEELYIGRIVNVSMDEKYLDAQGMPDLTKFTPITYDPANHKYIALGDVVGNAFSDGKQLS